MKKELYEYVYPPKKLMGQQVTNGKRRAIFKKEDLIGYISVGFIFLAFSIPMALSLTWQWLIIFTMYIVTLIICKIDKDSYSGFLLLVGASMTYLGIVLSYLIVVESFKRFRFSATIPLIILSAVCILCYETIVSLNILTKRYSARNNSQKSYPAIYTTVGTFLGGIIGGLIARKVSQHIANSFWSIWLALIACALLFVTAFSFFQKYILCKILKKDSSK